MKTGGLNSAAGDYKSKSLTADSGIGSPISLIPGVVPQIQVIGAGRTIEIYNLTDAKPYVRFMPDIYGVPSISVGSITISNGPGYPATPANDAVQLISASGKLQPIYRDFSAFASIEVSSLRLVKGGFFAQSPAWVFDCATPTSTRGWTMPDSNPTAGQIPYVVSIASGIATIGYKDEAAGGSPSWATPGTIGSTTPNTGAFTTLAASGALTLNGMIRLSASQSGSVSYANFTPANTDGISATFNPGSNGLTNAYSFEFGTRADATNDARMIFVGNSAGHIVAGDARGSGTARPLIFRAGTGDWSALPDLLTISTNSTVSIRNPKLTNLSPTVGNAAIFSGADGTISPSTGLTIDGSGNLTTPSVLLRNGSFTSSILPGTLASNQSLTLPVAAPIAGNLPFSTTTGGVLGWSTGLTYSTSNQTLAAASTGNNSAIASSASGTAAAFTASNTNATLTTPTIGVTRSTSTAGITNLGGLFRAGSSAAGNGGELGFNALSSTSTNLKGSFFQWQLPANVIASYTSQFSIFASDFGNTTGREALRVAGNGTRAVVSVPSGNGLAIGSTTDPGANNLSVAGVVKLGVFTVGTLPTASASGNGAIAHASNGRKSGEGAAAGTGVPTWCDGTNWRTYYDNSVVAA
jgi:hypothetical protein